jgi:hypothetical protein
MGVSPMAFSSEASHGRDAHDTKAMIQKPELGGETLIKTQPRIYIRGFMFFRPSNFVIGH